MLDCEYDLGPDETGFVLKWLYNDTSVYQWIPGHKPYALVSLSFAFKLFKKKKIVSN